MNKIFTVIALFLVLCVMPQALSAQSANSLNVYATTAGGDVNFINEVVDSSPNIDTFVLMSRDTSYYYNDVITLVGDFSIIGELDPVTQRPPTVQPLELDDLSVPTNFLSVTGNGSQVLMQNVFFLARSQSNTLAQQPSCVTLSADDVNLTVDNCVFDSWMQFTFDYSGVDNAFTITNNVFRNGVMPGNNPWVGEVLRNLVGVNATDAVVFRNNTMLNVGAYSVCTHTFGALNKSLVFDHNTVVYGTKNVFFAFYSTDVEITNNIFYSTFCAGGNNASITGNWDDLDQQTISVISFDTLTTAVHDTLFAPEFVGDANSRQLIEAKREISVKNNVYYWPESITSFWTAFNDTASAANARVLPLWMNERTTGMFADDTMWPNFVEENNQDVDPGFPQDIVDIATQSSEGFIAYLKNAYEGGPNSTLNYSYAKNEPTGQIDWVPAWPLVENLAYSNVALQTGGTDGKAIGDLRWYPDQATAIEGEEEVPTEFSLSNNYPNPFNPSTNINFTIPSAGEVSLKVYDVMGREAKTVLEASQQAAGAYSYSVDMNGFASGIYFYTLSHNGSIQTKKMLLLK